MASTTLIRKGRGVTQLARHGYGVCGWRNRSRRRPTRRPGSVHREPIAYHPDNTAATSTRPIEHRPAGLCQTGHRETDWLPVTISAQERHIAATWNSQQWKTFEFYWLQRNNFARAPKNSREFKGESHISMTLTALVHGVQSYRKFGPCFQTSTRSSPPNSGWHSWNWDRIESVLRLADTSMTTTHLSTFGLFKVIVRYRKRTPSSSNMWSNYRIYGRFIMWHARSQQYLEKILWNGLIAGRIGRREGRKAVIFSAAHPKNIKAVPDQQCLQPQIVAYRHSFWNLSGQSTRCGSEIQWNTRLWCCSLRRHSSRK